MKATASIRVAVRGGRSELVDRRSQAPLSVRRCGGRIIVAASAATPVGGDELRVNIDVDEGAHADIGSVAASMIWPGPNGAASAMTTTARIASGGRLDLWPEPTISVVGSTHAMTTRVWMEAGATARVVEEVVLGRRNESSGDVRMSLRIERNGHPLVHHDEHFGPQAAGAASSVSIGGARHVLAAVLVGVEAGRSRVRLESSHAGAWLPVADDCVVVLALGADRPAVRALVHELAPELLAAGSQWVAA